MQHFGQRRSSYVIGGEEYSVNYEVTAVKGPIIALSALEDSGWVLNTLNGENSLEARQVHTDDLEEKCVLD